MNKFIAKRIYYDFHLDVKMSEIVLDIERTIKFYNLENKIRADEIGYFVLEKSLGSFRDLRQLKKMFSSTRSLDNRISNITSGLDSLPINYLQKD